MRKQKFKLVVGILATMIASVVMATPVNALQSRPDGTSLSNTTAGSFFTKIRQMESTVLGLETNFEATTWLDSSGNGVDVHMAKNTEWGTAAMLSASAYGTAPSGTSSASTTGNATGVYQMAGGKREYVAGIYKSSTTNTGYWGTIKTADARYYNDYSSGASIAGDATTETAGWKGVSNATFVSSTHPVFNRSYDGLFGYDNIAGHAYGDGGSRAVLVLGAGL